MKGTFIYYRDIEKGKASGSGIGKKVLSQMKVLNEAGLNCSLFVLPYSGGRLSKLLYRLPFTNSFHKWEYNRKFDGQDYIYFRRPNCLTRYTIKTLKKIREKNPRIKIILEIPTYPYDKELCVFKRDIPLLIKDRVNRRKLKGLVDRIATLTDDKAIFGIETLKFNNGVDLSSIRVKNTNNTDDCIDLCAVAMYVDWHGYDRILEGMGRYYAEGGKRNIVFHIAGEGTERKRYEKIIARYKIEDHVKFYGKVFGEQLDSIYDRADIAVDVFGMYRKNNYMSYSLKSREYLAKGLPIISGCKVDIIPDDFKYFKVFENNKNPVDMNLVIDFYDQLYPLDGSRSQVAKNIREFAEKNCNINDGMKNIVNYLKSGTGANKNKNSRKQK